MGLTYIEATIANPAKPRKTARVKFLVDSGAAYSVVPAPVLRRMGIKPHTKRSSILTDGTTVTRRMGEALFRFNNHEGTSPVIFGQKDDSILLGSVSLEVLGFILDPLKRELRPLPMLLAAQRGRESGRDQSFRRPGRPIAYAIARKSRVRPERMTPALRPRCR